MLLDYRYPQAIAVQSGASRYIRHRFKHLGAHDLCLFSRGVSVHLQYI